MEQLPPIIHNSWQPHLQSLFDDPKMGMLKNMLFGHDRVYFHPEKKDIFRVFSMPLQSIKVCLLGQDPYPNGEGVGLAFAVNSAAKIPPSLRIIKKEVDSNTELKYFKPHSDIMWQTLNHWVDQGVFLLNTALTVEHANAGSHLGQWQWFTREVVKIISTQQKPVWLLWGAKAKGFKDYIVTSITVTNPEQQISGTMDGFNFVLEGNHPAAEAYPDSKYKFSGCNHFNLCNEILKAKGLEQIKW